MENMVLVIFTFFIQAAIGIMFFVAIGKLINKEAVFKLPVLTAAGLVVVGLLASLLNLGRPLAAINALARFGSSWLSTEVWCTSIFTGLTLVTVALILFKPSAKKAINVLVPVSAVIGFIDIYAMASIYYFASVPAWHSSATFLQFYATSVSVGAVLFVALGRNEAAIIRKSTVVAVWAAIVIQIIAMINLYLQLGTSSSLAAQQSAILLTNMSVDLMVQWILILVGAVLLIISVKS